MAAWAAVVLTPFGLGGTNSWGTYNLRQTFRLLAAHELQSLGGWKDRGGSFAGEPVIVQVSRADTRVDFFGTGQDREMSHFS